MAYFGVCSTIVVNLLQRDDPMLERVRFDHYRMRREAPKWERHLNSRTDGLVEPNERSGQQVFAVSSPNTLSELAGSSDSALTD